MSQERYGYRSGGCWTAPAPTSSRHKLAGVKHALYHPFQPTLRRMEMDSVVHKLSEQHSRTSTPFTQENFRNARFTSVAAPDHRLPSLEITDTGRQIAKRFATGTMAPLAQSTSQEEWSRFTSAAADWSQRSSSSGEFQVKDLKKQVLGYRGYAVCFLPTDGSRSWKKHIPFSWESMQFYQQQQGMLVEAAFTPSFANKFMHKIEQNLFIKNNTYKENINAYFRFVDKCLRLWQAQSKDV